MTRRVGGLIALGLLAFACGSDKSILVAGNDEASMTTPVSQTTIVNDPSRTPDATETTVEGQAPPTSAPTSAPITTPATNATTTTTPLDTLPTCPVDALNGADDVVEVTFWHGLNADNEDSLNLIVDSYNASQTRVRITAQNQGGYGETIDKYIQSSQDSRPDMVMFPDYAVQRIIDTDSVIPVGACLQTAAYDTSVFQQSTLITYNSQGVQWAMPFNVSTPVLYYNKALFRAAGLDPERSPQTLQELRDYSQQIVDSKAAAYGISLDSGTDSGGGWFIEQWLANGGDLYADNGNGRLAPATRVLFDGPRGVELLTYVQALIADGLAYNVGENPGGLDQFFKMADKNEPSAMTIGTSSGLGIVLNAVNGGLVEGITADDIGIGPFPGPGEIPSALVGGAALYVVAEHGDQKAAAAWDFITYLVSPEVQSQWTAATGFVPVRPDALEVEPAATVYRDDPRFRVAYDQLVNSPNDPAQLGPIFGPRVEVRAVTARAVADIFAGADVQASLTAAAQQANALIADYNARN